MFNMGGKKAFTIIELIVVIAVIGILVLLAGPRLLGYVEKAELTRIQHDVKVMEQEMKLALIGEEVEIAHWGQNKKSLGALVMQDKLFEKEGVAERIDASHLLKNNKGSMLSELAPNNELGVGGNLIPISGEDDNVSLPAADETYKIVPSEYKGVIGTRLGGTFYTNDIGKVYYEHDKPILGEKKGDKVLDCPLPLPDYDFEPETGTIVKWYGTVTHLVIPEAFKATINGEEQCVPVRIIGTEAFMQGVFKSIVIPQSVIRIEFNAFKDNLLTTINIPHSVNYIGEGAFSGNSFGSGGGGGSITIRNNSSNITIISGAFGGSTPTYRPMTPQDLNVVFYPSSGRIVSMGAGGGSSIIIPESFWVGGVEYPVKQIDKGAYQGLGLISVILPSSLEKIEDYAFAGNQLEGITIPDKVNHVGHYAFAFNEVEHTITGHRKATIGFINIKSEEQFDKVNQYGDIYENGVEVDKLKDEVKLLDHIFVTSIGNIVIDERYIGTNNIENIDSWITIQKWEQLIDAGEQGAIWLNSNIQDNIPEGTRIIYGYMTSDNQLTWSSESESIEDTPNGRYLKISIETQRLSSVSEIPRIINISPVYQIQNKVVQTESITKYNEKIDFTKYNNIIYVDSLNGSDSNPGTLGQPLKNIDTAYTRATNGDLLYLNKGVHILKIGTLTKKVDFYGLSNKTTLVFNGPYQRPFNAGNGYLGINPSADSGFYNMIIETRGSNTYANFFYNKGTLAFYNVAFNNFFNLDYTDFLIIEKGSLYLYNVVVSDSAARNMFVRLSTGYEGTLLLQNLYGNLTLDNIYSSRKIDVSVLKDSKIVLKAQLDANFNILEQDWENIGLGFNPDGSQANMGVHGGPNSWGFQ